NADGISPVEERVKAIREFPKPDSIRQLRRFLGMINFYRRFIEKAAHHLAPLNALLKGHKNESGKRLIEWTKETENSFEHIKEELSNATLLNHPIPGAQLAIFVDASDLAVGGSLVQKDGNDWNPISFFSAQLKSHQKKWSAYDRELFAAYQSGSQIKQTPDATYVDRLQKHMSGLLPHLTSDHSSSKIFLPKELRTCSNVFIRDDKVKSPLQNAYSGPYKVETRTEKNFVLRINNRRSNISIDRLKPAFIENDIKSHEFTH
ncbi:hypothetical protein B4U79_11538, partial [Dinothrombium tinctorium]